MASITNMCISGHRSNNIKNNNNGKDGSALNQDDNGDALEIDNGTTKEYGIFNSILIYWKCI